MGVTDLTNMIGYNYRMTEIEAAITREQLKKLDGLLTERQHNAAEMDNLLSDIPCLSAAPVREGCTHGYYQQPMFYCSAIADGIHRDVFINAVKAELPVTELRETEGVKIGAGYVKPIYWQPMFKHKQAYGSQGHPWSTFNSTVSYDNGLCPVTEICHTTSLIHHEMMRPLMSQADRQDVAEAFHKVWNNRHHLVHTK
jgi:dTDP-4-amino-4,6-dideoxygalactose transaminase